MHVTIAASGTYAVFIDDAESAASVLLNSASATLLVEGGPGVALTLGTSLTATAGTLSLVADDTSSYGSITGGTVTVNAGANLFAQSFTQDPNFSTFEIDSAVNIAGHAVVASDTDLLFRWRRIADRLVLRAGRNYAHLGPLHQRPPDLHQFGRGPDSARHGHAGQLRNP